MQTIKKLVQRQQLYFTVTCALGVHGKVLVGRAAGVASEFKARGCPVLSAAGSS